MFKERDWHGHFFFPPKSEKTCLILHEEWTYRRYAWGFLEISQHTAVLSGWRTEVAWAGGGKKDREDRAGFRGTGVGGLGVISKGEGMKRIKDMSQFLAWSTGWMVMSLNKMGKWGGFAWGKNCFRKRRGNVLEAERMGREEGVLKKVKRL